MSLDHRAPPQRRRRKNDTNHKTKKGRFVQIESDATVQGSLRRKVGWDVRQLEADIEKLVKSQGL